MSIQIIDSLATSNRGLSLRSLQGARRTPVVPINASLSWNQSTDTYSNQSPVLDIQSRMRRCLLLDNGTVNYYLDADNSAKKSGDWLRIVETQTISAEYTGTLSESQNSTLRYGVNNWVAGTVGVLGERVIHNGSLWECVVAGTTAEPAAGTVDSSLTGADGQVMVEIPAFSVKYSFANNTHNWEIRRGIQTTNGWSPHRAFLRGDGVSYRNYLYVGAYQVTGTSPATTVSGVSNRVNMTRAAQRSASAARGTGWHQWSQYDLAAIQLLMITEFANVNSQRVLGNGSQGGNTYSVTTGLSNARGNRSHNSTGANNSSDYISYRGLENIYGRAWQYTDGINATSYTSIFLCSAYTNFAGGTSTNYISGGTIATGNNQTGFLQNGTVFLSGATSSGSNTTHVGDVAGGASAGGFVAYKVGGAANSGSQAGVFAFSLGNGDTGGDTSTSSRLAYGAI